MFYIFQCASLEHLRFIPKCFNLVWCYLVLFFISVSNCSLLVYRKTTDFWTVILYPATLLNWLISTNSIFIDFIRFFYINNHATCKLGLFCFFFFTLDSFSFLSFFLIALSRSSSIQCWVEVGKADILFLLLILGESNQSFTVSVMLAVGFS